MDNKTYGTTEFLENNQLPTTQEDEFPPYSVPLEQREKNSPKQNESSALEIVYDTVATENSVPDNAVYSLLDHDNMNVASKINKSNSSMSGRENPGFDSAYHVLEFEGTS